MNIVQMYKQIVINFFFTGKDRKFYYGLIKLGFKVRH